MGRAGKACCPQGGLSEGWAFVGHLRGWEAVFPAGISEKLYIYEKLLLAIECIILCKE